jgi:PiT family inorganic phosphate transporter
VAGNIAVAWVVTLPAAGIFGAVIYGLQRVPGRGVQGPLVIIAIAAIVSATIMVIRRGRVAEAAR